MSYLVLARKWRPQVFEEVVGQVPITQTLQNAISQKRVPHAFLFAGARGVGKTSTARILAKALNCETGPRINPCNQCASCHEISAGTSMDVIEIDGASNRGIDEIRELRDNVRYTPAKSRYKIYIIDEVHMLTREAFNALLKTLEEPPPHIIFVFATTEPHKIPATILSRCQRYDFKRIPLKKIVESLSKIVEEEGVQVSQRGLLSIARESEGSMRDAQSLLDQVISYAGTEIKDENIAEVLGLVDRKLLYDTLEAIAGGNPGRCLEVVEEIYQYGYDVQHFCRELLQCFRNLILLKVAAHPEALMELPAEEIETLGNLAKKFEFEHLNHLFNLLLKGEEEVAQSTFPRTMLEMTLIRMATLRPVVSIDEILKKLEELEKSPLSAAPLVERNRDASPDEKLSREKSTNQTARPMRNIESTELEKSFSPEHSEQSEDPGEEHSPVREEAWKNLVNFARMKNPVLGAFLVFGNLVQLSEDRIEIGFEKDSFHYDRMLEKENRDLLERICREYLGKEAKLVISTSGPGTRLRTKEFLETEGSIHGETKKLFDKEAEESPIIQEALRLFDGRIVDR